MVGGGSDVVSFRLVRCDASGVPVEAIGALPQELADNCRGTAELYVKLGYAAPWVGYVAVTDGRPVGGGAFVGAPREGRVELAYYTLQEYQGRGHANATARELVRLAREADPAVTLIAFTLPEPNASTRILEKQGFVQTGLAQDPDAGTVWEWQLPPR